MGDTEFDSFFDDGAPAAEPAAAPPADDSFDFGADDSTQPAPAAEPTPGGMDSMDMGDMQGMDMSSAFVTTTNMTDSGPLA